MSFVILNKGSLPDDDIAPAALENLTATVGASAVLVEWDASPAGDNTLGYRVYRSTTTGGPSNDPYVLQHNPALLITDNAFIDVNVTAGATYYYVVIAVDDYGNASAISNEDSATIVTIDDEAPSVPTGLAADDAVTVIDLTWDAHPDDDGDLAGFRLYRNTTGAALATGDLLQVALVTGTSFTDTNVVAGTTYYYGISAVDDAPEPNESAISAAVSATIPADVLAPPVVLGSNNQENFVQVAWNHTGVLGDTYNVYRSTDGINGTYTKITASPVAASPYNDTTIALDTRGHYYLTTVRAGNESVPSAKTEGHRVGASSASVTLVATESWHINRSAAGSLSVGGNDIKIGKQSGNSREGFIRFAMPPVIAQGATISSAVPKLVSKGTGTIAEDVIVAHRLITTISPTTPTTYAEAIALPQSASAGSWTIPPFDTTEVTHTSTVDMAALFTALVASGSYTPGATIVLVLADDGSTNGASRTAQAGHNATVALRPTIEMEYTTTGDSLGPSAPTGLTATATASGNVLGWVACVANDLAGYRLYRRQGASGDYTLLNTGALLTGAAYTDTDGLITGASYTYGLVAVDDTGNAGPTSATASCVAIVDSGPGEEEPPVVDPPSSTYAHPGYESCGIFIEVDTTSGNNVLGASGTYPGTRATETATIRIRTADVGSGAGSWQNRGSMLAQDDDIVILNSQGNVSYQGTGVEAFAKNLMFLTPATLYDVEVTFSDADLSPGANPFLFQFTTKSNAWLTPYDELPLPTHYLSPTGNDNNLGTTAGAPWRTAARVASAAQVSSTDMRVMLLPGLYDYTMFNGHEIRKNAGVGGSVTFMGPEQLLTFNPALGDWLGEWEITAAWADQAVIESFRTGPSTATELPLNRRGGQPGVWEPVVYTGPRSGDSYTVYEMVIPFLPQYVSYLPGTVPSAEPFPIHAFDPKTKSSNFAASSLGNNAELDRLSVEFLFTNNGYNYGWFASHVNPNKIIMRVPSDCEDDDPRNLYIVVGADFPFDVIMTGNRNAYGSVFRCTNLRIQGFANGPTSKLASRWHVYDGNALLGMVFGINLGDKTYNPGNNLVTPEDTLIENNYIRKHGLQFATGQDQNDNRYLPWRANKAKIQSISTTPGPVNAGAGDVLHSAAPTATAENADIAGTIMGRLPVTNAFGGTAAIGKVLRITAGPGTGYEGEIVEWANIPKQLWVYPAFGTLPTTGSTFQIIDTDEWQVQRPFQKSEGRLVGGQGGGRRTTVRNNTGKGAFNGIGAKSEAGLNDRYGGFAYEIYENTIAEIADDAIEFETKGNLIRIWRNTFDACSTIIAGADQDWGYNTFVLNRVYDFGFENTPMTVGVPAGPNAASPRGVAALLNKFSGGNLPQTFNEWAFNTIHTTQFNTKGFHRTNTGAGWRPAQFSYGNVFRLGYVFSHYEEDPYYEDYNLIAAFHPDEEVGTPRYNDMGTVWNNNGKKTITAWFAASGQGEHSNFRGTANFRDSTIDVDWLDGLLTDSANGDLTPLSALLVGSVPAIANLSAFMVGDPSYGCYQDEE